MRRILILIVKAEDGYSTRFQLKDLEVKAVFQNPVARRDAEPVAEYRGRPITFHAGWWVHYVAADDRALQHYMRHLCTLLDRYNQRVLASYGMAWRHYHEMQLLMDATRRADLRLMLSQVVSAVYAQRGRKGKTRTLVQNLAGWTADR